VPGDDLAVGQEDLGLEEDASPPRDPQATATRENSSAVEANYITVPPGLQINEKSDRENEEEASPPARLRNVHFTTCQIFCNTHDVKKISSKFLPDPGSLSVKVSGNYISKNILDLLVKEYGIKIYKDNKKSRCITTL